MNKTVAEGISIILGVFTVFIVQITTLSNYSSYLLAILIIFSAIYIALKKRSKPASPSLGGSGSELFTGGPVELFGIVSVITLIISLTNGLASPLFFFIYFLLFLLAFIGRSGSIFILLFSLLLYFIPEASNAPTTNTFIKLGSLILLTPIAFFLSRELERRQLLSQRVEAKSEEIIQEAEALKESISPTQTEETEAIDEIIEEAESLKKDSEE